MSSLNELVQQQNIEKALMTIDKERFPFARNLQEDAGNLDEINPRATARSNDTDSPSLEMPVELPLTDHNDTSKSSSIDDNVDTDVLAPLLPEGEPTSNVVAKEMIPYLANASIIDIEAHLIYHHMRDDGTQESKLISIFQELEHLCRQVNPQINVRMYGSSVSGFRLKDSDIDLCVRFEDSNKSEHNFLFQLYEKLKESHPIQPQQKPIVHARGNDLNGIEHGANQVD